MSTSPCADLLGIAPDAMLLVDGGIVLAANARAEKLFGHAPGGLAGRAIAELVPGGLPAGPEPDALVERTGRRTDGSAVALELTAAPARAGLLWSARPAPARRASDSARQQAAIAEIGRLALGDPEPALLLDTAVRLVRDVLGADVVAIMEIGPDGRATVSTGAGLEPPAAEIPLAGTVAALALERREPVIVHDLRTDPRITSAKLAELGILSGLSTPLLVGDAPVGALSAASRTPGVFRASHLDFVAGVGSLLAVAAARRRAGGELAESRARLRAIVDHTPAAVYMTDLAGRFSLVNRTAAQLLGAEPDALLGRDVADVLSPQAAALSATGDAEVVRHGRPVSIEEVLIAPGGEERTFAAVKFPVFDAGRRLVGIGAVAMDVTERRRTEADREALADRLRRAERMESVGQLAGGIAHDFNNLLAVIVNFASFVQTEVEPGSAAAEDVEQILAAAGRAAELTRRLLLFSRSRTGGATSADLVAVTDGLREILRRSLGEHIELRIRAEDGLWPVTADPSRLEQVLVNLAVNARDAMPRGGVVSIDLGNVVLDTDGARAEGDPSLVGPFVRLTVSDTGTGMDAATIERAFEPFFTTKPGDAGTGLGLATVYGIVTGAGGHVAIASEPGAGTTIRVHLPMAGGAPQARDTAPEPDAVAAGAGERVLVVEDDHDVRLLAGRILAGAGYAVTEARTAAEALERLAGGERFDLVVTDVVMPGMSGHELAAALAEIDLPPGVLFISGRAAGAPGPTAPAGTETVPKPFTASELLLAVRRGLDRAAAA